MICDTPRFMIAAPSSGSGKTTVTCALLSAMKNMGKKPASFKCGPDYIDPMFHTKVLGVPSSNLDLFLTGEEICRYILCKNADGADIAVIEGVMGYYDGLGTDGLYSSYHLARFTGTPAILVADCKGVSLTLAATVKGAADFRDDSNIKGVILNNANEKSFPMYREMIERETGVPVLGYLPALPDCRFESRRLGLVTPAETSDIASRLQKLAETAAKTIDIDRIFQIAGGISGLSCEKPAIEKKFSVKIAVAMDNAFCFYYHDALELLCALGAEIAYFSPLKDKKMPDCDGFIIGGGYPELYIEELSANKNMLRDIKTKAGAGLPHMAECGGFLYLMDEITGLCGNTGAMAGVISGKAFITKKLARFGYAALTAKTDNILCREGETIHAHEFHYSDTTNNGCSFSAKKPTGGTAWDCVIADERRFAGFSHIHLLGNIRCAENFLKVCQREKDMKCAKC